jgi:hypothetical protein
VHVASVIHGLGEARCQLDGIFHGLFYPDRVKLSVGYGTAHSRLLKGERKTHAKRCIERHYIKVLAGGTLGGRKSVVLRSHITHKTAR